MNESFIHYIWQHQYFNRKDLQTMDGDDVQIFFPGNYNRNAGPDFLEAKIKVGAIEWAGSVEIHINSSDFNNHNHQVDHAYNNVVLHVVWKHDREVMREDGSVIPTIELRTRVDEKLVKDYRKLVDSSFQIPCTNSFSRASSLTIVSMIERAAIQRLTSKASGIQQLYHENTGDWEETFYQVVARNFGFKVNSDAFTILAKTLPLRIIRKNSDELLKVEALLLGIAGFLELKKGDDYYMSLQKELSFLTRKFDLTDRKMNRSQWKFLRLRPANFPTLRLAQLASVLKNSTAIFEKVIDTSELTEVRKIFSTGPSSYWLTHYSFGKQSNRGHGRLGEESLNNLLINSVIPTLAAFARERDDEMYFKRALDFLQQLKPESNSILRAWQSLNVHATNSFDSQALIEQMNSNCKKRNCLNCSIGASLLKPA